ncbi:hypothetical protein Sjap_006441 [Stephania japonica]|uniref:Uncharacterized protein n=1 Tax=Stephania japonica TaxID=461633 RepID=A0AAP0K7E1_9MAGN
MLMIDYLSKMKELSNRLAIAGSPGLDDDLITSVLAGLDKEYLPITTTLLQDLDLSWSDVHTSLLNFEERMN